MVDDTKLYPTLAIGKKAVPQNYRLGVASNINRLWLAAVQQISPEKGLATNLPTLFRRGDKNPIM